MVTTRSGQGSAPAALPSFEEIFETQQRRPLLTTEANRLRWVLHGPLETAITVLKQPYHEPGVAPEPYCTSQEGDDNHPTWHAVAQAAYTEPKVSSVTVSVTQIDDWEEMWYEQHRRCTDPPSDNEEGDDYDFPSQCCGEQRPHPQDMTLTVRASGEFVTVHDYVSAVHPWLLPKHDDILSALGVLEDKPPLSLLPAGKHLMVTLGGADQLSVGTEEEWLLNKDKRMYLYYEEERQKPGPGKGVFVGMAPNQNMGKMPVDKDGKYVELRGDDDFGPWLGYVGPWPAPYVTLDEETGRMGDMVFTKGYMEVTGMVNEARDNSTLREVQMTGRVKRMMVARMARNGDIGEIPVDADGNYVELRADDDFGPWPGYVGPWPVPLASPDEVHAAATRHVGTWYEGGGLTMKGDSDRAIQREVQMTGRWKGNFVRMAPNPGMGMMPVDKDGNFVELREFGNHGPWPGHVGPWPIPYTGVLTTIGEGYQGARPFGSEPPAEQEKRSVDKNKDNGNGNGKDKSKGKDTSVRQEETQMPIPVELAKGKFVRMVPYPNMGMIPVGRDGIYVDIRIPGASGPWPGYVGTWPPQLGPQS